MIRPPGTRWLQGRRPALMARRTVSTLQSHSQATSRRLKNGALRSLGWVGVRGDCLVAISLPFGGVGVGGAEEFGLVRVQGGSERLVWARSHAGADTALH